jgi:colanic acid/amylovoran biosynthesis protein
LSKLNNVRNVLIVNIHSSENAGDYALLLQTIHYLKKTFGNININIVANWPNETALLDLSSRVIGSPWWIIKVWDKNKKPRYQVLSFILGIFFLFLFRIDILDFYKIVPENWRDIFVEYKETDLVVAVSGNQLFSSGRFGWPLPIIGFPIYLAKYFQKKVLVFPQSVGPLKTNFEKKVVKYLYNNVEKLYIRDLNSIELVRSLNINKSKPSFMHDLAFTLPPAIPEVAEQILKPVGFDDSHTNIGMTIISSMPSYLTTCAMNSYYENIAKTIDNLVNNHNFDVFLFCQVYGPTEDENDFLGIDRTIKLLPHPENKKIHIINKKLHPAKLKACYGLMDLFIASRLHSGIFALGMRVPTLFIGYLYKTEGVLKSLNLAQYNVELSDVSHDIIVDRLIGMWKEKTKLLEVINSEIMNVENELAGFPHEIRTVLNYEN